MIGDKLYKNNKEDMARYTEEAIWCNSNNAHIEDKGAYYKVCENVPYTPTVEEQLAELDRQYNSDKAILMSQYTEADIDGDEELKASVKAELVALREQYDKDYADIVGGDE
jgi:hypothetical protein